MRITKKFAGSSCIGKQVYSAALTTEAHRQKSVEVNANISRLESAFLLRLQQGEGAQNNKAHAALTLDPTLWTKLAHVQVPRLHEEVTPAQLLQLQQQLRAPIPDPSPAPSPTPDCASADANPTPTLSLGFVSRVQQQQHLMHQFERLQVTPNPLPLP